MRWKGLVVGVLILLMSVNIGSTFARDTELIGSVVFDGNTLYVGGTGPNNYTKIQDAIDNASDGDTVFVYDDSSPYYENVVINKSVNLVGENKDTTIIDGGGNGDVIYVSAGFINIHGLQIVNKGDDEWDDAGIDIRSSNTIISGNIIKCGPKICLYFEKSNNIIVKENELNNVYMKNCSNNTIIDNDITGSYGILFRYSCNNFIYYNNITGKDGITLEWYSDNNQVYCNKISDSYTGIWISRSSKNVIYKNDVNNHIDFGIRLLRTSNYNNIHNNTVNDNRYGFQIWESAYNNIHGNIVQRNHECFFLKDASNNMITWNDIAYNDWGIWLLRSSDNIIYCNNFRENKIKAVFTNCENEWDSNYWGRTIFNLKMIFGVIKSIPRFNFDNHPVKEPYDIPNIWRV